MIKKFCDRCGKEMPKSYTKGESIVKMQVLEDGDWQSCEKEFCPSCTRELEKIFKRCHE